MAPTCDICVGNINKVNFSVSCIQCDFTCCKTCFRRYITEAGHYFQCMSCNVEFDRYSLFKRLGSTFMKNEYKYIREIMLFETEKSLLPATQLLLEKELEIEKLQKQLGSITTKYDSIRDEKILALNKFVHSKDITTVCDAINKYILMVEETNMEERIQDESQAIEIQISTMRGSTENVKKTFIRKCAHAECNGMLSHENRTPLNNYKCILCDSIACHACREIISDEQSHECNQETLDTVTYIEESSKPCPSCASPIHKLEGCFDKNTIIPLANGINKCAHEIEMGDQLVGDDFQHRTVLQTFNGSDQLYQVDQEHGETYIVNSRHNLVLSKQNGSQYVIDLTTYMELTDSQKAELYGYKINAATGTKTLSRLTIKPYKYDQYNGFVVDGNHKFLYTDGTVLANCDQMFCVNCHTAFSWKTLKIVTGTVHNPHYFEWQRQQGNQTRDPLDIQCGQEVDHRIIRYCQNINAGIISTVKSDAIKQMERAMNVLMQKIPHLQHWAIPRYQGTNLYARNQALRLQLLRQHITETEFKIKIQRSDKAESKKRDILNILVTYRDAATDITFRMHDKMRSKDYKTIDHFGQFYTEYMTLKRYVDQCLTDVALAYDSSMDTHIENY